MPTDTRVILVTAPQGGAASDLARRLVDERLVACVNVVPTVRSIYRWEGKVEDEAESLLILKTRAHLVQRLTDRIQELHPYDVPEVLSLEVDEGASAYLAWLGAQLEPA